MKCSTLAGQLRAAVAAEEMPGKEAWAAEERCKIRIALVTFALKQECQRRIDFAGLADCMAMFEKPLMGMPFWARTGFADVLAKKLEEYGDLDIG